MADNAVHLWWGRLSELATPDLIKLYETRLPALEVEKSDRLVSVDDQRVALTTRAMVRTVLSCYSDRSPFDWHFLLSGNGKPKLAEGDEDLNFSLSHSGSLVVCAVCRGFDVGVDTEARSQNRDFVGLARRYFSPEEYREITELPVAQRSDRFYDLWTLRESLVKASGIGLGSGLAGIRFSPDSDGGYSLVSAGSAAASGAGWQHELLSTDGQSVAITYSGLIAAVSVYSVTADLIHKYWLKVSSTSRNLDFNRCP